MRRRLIERPSMSDRNKDRDPDATAPGPAADPPQHRDRSPARQEEPAPQPPDASTVTTARMVVLRENIERLLRENRLKPAQLARKLGLANGNLFYNFRNGHSESLSADTLVRICDAFPGLTIDELVGRTPWRGVRGRSPAPRHEPDLEAPGPAARQAASARGVRPKQRQALTVATSPTATPAAPNRAALLQAATATVDALGVSLGALRLALAVAADAPGSTGLPDEAGKLREVRARKAAYCMLRAVTDAIQRDGEAVLGAVKGLLALE